MTFFMFNNVIFTTQISSSQAFMNRRNVRKFFLIKRTHRTINNLLNIPRLNICVDIWRCALNNDCSRFFVETRFSFYYCSSRFRMAINRVIAIGQSFSHSPARARSFSSLSFLFCSLLDIWSVYIYQCLKCTRACHYFAHFCSFGSIYIYIKRNRKKKENESRQNENPVSA
jgi:hypothetical protein